MIKLVLVRHGESIWNKENRFAGWTDVELSEEGKKEAIEAGKKLYENGFDFDIVYTSVLKRALDTLNLILNEMHDSELTIKIAKKPDVQETPSVNPDGTDVTDPDDGLS